MCLCLTLVPESVCSRAFDVSLLATDGLYVIGVCAWHENALLVLLNLEPEESFPWGPHLHEAANKTSTQVHTWYAGSQLR